MLRPISGRVAYTCGWLRSGTSLFLPGITVARMAPIAARLMRRHGGKVTCCEAIEWGVNGIRVWRPATLARTV